VVEDDSLLRELELLGLGMAGYDTLAAGDGVEAMECVGREPFDLILLDIELPIVGGLQFLEWLRGLKPDGVPAIVYTGHRDPMLAERARQLGATRVLWKPICLDEILQTVQSVLRV
jgi:CheY-like chemotaxis protein